MTQFEGHTEGPWLHCKSPVNGGEQFWSVVDHTQDTDVGDDTLGNWRIADIVDYEVDAKLLAAGPTLLAELKRCYERIDELSQLLEWIYDSVSAVDQTIEEMDERLDRVCDAIESGYLNKEGFSLSGCLNKEE